MGKYKINNRTGKFDLVGKEGGGTDTPIVTEQRNGLETSLDKRLADHSYNNVMILEKTFATPEDASDFLCSLDDQYYPVAGQIMQYTDTKGDKHIVRYTGSYKIRRDGVANAWGDVVWDSINGCYFAYQKATTDVITYGVNYNSSFWNIHDLSTQKKNWRYCAADDRLGVIIVAGNNATEYITSTDAFKTYSLKSGRSGYHTNVKGRDAVVNGVKERRFITITSSGNMPMDDIYIDALKASGNYDELYNAKTLITSSHIGYRNCTDFDINVRNNVNDLFLVWRSNDFKCYLSWYSDGSKISTIELPNSVSKVYYEEGKLYCYIGDYGRPTGGFDAYVIGIDYANNSLAIERTFADTHSILNTKYGIVALRHKQIILEGEEIELPVELGQYEILTTMTTNGEDCLMVVTGNHTAEDGYKGNYGFLVDLKKKKIINVERWEEMPVIPDGIEGVMRVSGNKVEELKLSERLEITDGTLDVKASDRTTAYKSYRLGASGEQTFAEVWTKKKRNELAVGQTVYSDEDCTTAAGTIKQVGNLNNPDDIVVTMTAGGDDVYHYSSILDPQTVASTKAVVDLGTKLGGLQKVTYAELVALRDGKKLVGGKKYRITDYECTSSDEETQCAGHNYDIIVTALDEETLSEECSAIQHEGDTYFNGQNLNAWKVCYCLNNDASRFSWAKQGGKQAKVEFYGMEVICVVLSENDTTYEGLPIKVIGSAMGQSFIAYTQYGETNSVFDLGGFTQGIITNTTYIGDVVGGKGVVYRLIDDKGNDVSYDFKNLMFKRYKITSEDSQFFGRYYGVKDRENYEIDEEDYQFFYTFSVGEEDGNIQDFSLSSFVCNNNLNGKQNYNNIFFSTFGNICSFNTFGDFCVFNTFGDYCVSNTFGNYCVSNTFGDKCESNTFGYYCRFNTFIKNCVSNTFGDMCEFNTFGDYCKFNTFRSNCSSNTFGDMCESNTFGNYCVSNTFGYYCKFNTFRSNCSSNTFGIYCSYNTFGNYCKYIELKAYWSYCIMSDKILNLNEQRTYDNTSRRYYYDSNYNIKDEIISYIH